MLESVLTVKTDDTTDHPQTHRQGVDMADVDHRRDESGNTEATAPLLTPTQLRKMVAVEGRAYLVMVPHGWGKDSNAAKALTIAKRNGSYNDKAEAIVINVPTDAYVDEMGWVHWSDRAHQIQTVGRVKLTTPGKR